MEKRKKRNRKSKKKIHEKSKKLNGKQQEMKWNIFRFFLIPHIGKLFLNLVYLEQIRIVITLFQLICHQMEFRI